jgi:hypothetical protein
VKAHRTDSISLFFGLAFLIVSLGYLANVYLNLNLPSMGWFVAAGLVFLGIVGAITALVPTKRATPEQEPVVQEQAEVEEAVEEEASDAERAR